MNKNFLAQNGYKLIIDRIPHVEYFVQSVDIPGFSVGAVKIDTPIKSFNVHGDSGQKESLSATIYFDEDLEGYNEIYTWIKGISGEDGFDYHRRLLSGSGVYSDASIIILNNAGNPNIELTFERLFPVSITGLTLDATISDIGTTTFTVSFEHDGFELKKIKNTG